MRDKKAPAAKSDVYPIVYPIAIFMNIVERPDCLKAFVYLDFV